MAYGNILQTLPALPGWEAVYSTSKIRKNPTYEFKPIVCWATVEFFTNSESIPTTIVVGLVVANSVSPVLDFADMAGRFIGYNYPGCNADWTKQARWGKPATKKEGSSNDSQN